LTSYETLKKVGLLAVGGVQLAWGFKAKLEKLKKFLDSIRAVLRDAEDKQAENSSVKEWLQKLRELAYEADDVLDEFGYEVLRQKVETTEKVRNFFPASNPIVFRLQTALKIDKINAELSEIKNDAASFGLISVAISMERAPHTGAGRVVTDSILNMAEIILTFALEETLKKVGLLAVGGVQLAWGLKAKLQKLNQSLESIRALLRDAEDKQAEKPFVRDWLRKLREVAYEADDVLDEFGYEVLRQKVETTPTEKMGEIVLTFVVEQLLNKLASLALEEISLLWGLKGKLQKLKSTLIFIRSVLHDAEEKQVRQEFVKIWMQRLRDVAYEAEDVLDEFGYEVLRQKVEGTTPSKKVSKFFSVSSSNPIAVRHHLGKKIKKINDELAEIKDE
ncbi:hypothetical protein Tsubulata_044473, partial [Turnera subulata]